MVISASTQTSAVLFLGTLTNGRSSRHTFFFLFSTNNVGTRTFNEQARFGMTVQSLNFGSSLWKRLHANLSEQSHRSSDSRGRIDDGTVQGLDKRYGAVRGNNPSFGIWHPRRKGREGHCASQDLRFLEGSVRPTVAPSRSRISGKLFYYGRGSLASWNNGTGRITSG